MKEIGSIFPLYERPLTRPSDTLSPKGEGEVSNTPLLEPSQAIKGNIFLAPWGEDARRAGEGPWGLWVFRFVFYYAIKITR